MTITGKRLVQSFLKINKAENILKTLIINFRLSRLGFFRKRTRCELKLAFSMV